MKAATQQLVRVTRLLREVFEELPDHFDGRYDRLEKRVDRAEAKAAELVQESQRKAVEVRSFSPKALRKLAETCCSHCDYEESDGSLIDHCKDCRFIIVKELWALTHQ